MTPSIPRKALHILKHMFDLSDEGVCDGSTERCPIRFRRKTAHDQDLRDIFRLWLGERVLTQKRRDPLPKVYSLARAGGRVHRQGQGAQALRVRVQGLGGGDQQPCSRRPVRHPHGPYDGHTLNTVIMERWTGVGIERAYVDKLRSTNRAATIKKELRRRSAVEAVIQDRRPARKKLPQGPRRTRPSSPAPAINYRLVLRCAGTLFARSGANLQRHPPSFTTMTKR